MTVQLPCGLRMEYGEYGDPGGSPLLYFHGWPSSHPQAMSLHRQAQTRGVRVIAPNRPGIGGSTAQPGRTLADWPPLIYELVQQLEIESCAVLGVSGGGPYALATAAELPGLVTSVGIACGAVPLSDFPDRHGMLFAYRVLLWLRKWAPWTLPPVIQAGRLISKCPPNRFPMTALLSPLELCDRHALSFENTYHEVMDTYRDAAASGTAAIIADADVYLQTWDIDLAEIRCPTYFWHGEKDQNIPIRMAKGLASRIPHAHCRWFSEEGHFSLGLRKTELFLDALFPERSSANATDQATSAEYP